MATPERAAFICSHLFEATRPALLVCVEDGDLMVLCGDGHPEDERWWLVGVNHLLDRDPSLAAVLDIEEGWEAERDTPDQPWRRSPLT